MKTILSSRKHHYLTRVGIFLIVMALVVWMVGCSCGGGDGDGGGDGLVEYDLTMAADPAAGGTATDETNGSPYAAGTAVSIKAVAAADYQFAGWTTTAGAFADANAASTIFAMPSADVTVTANFEPIPPDHFKGYWADSETYIGEVVYLEDQFGAVNATVGWCWGFGNPAEKVHGDVTTPISYPDHHFMLYDIDYEEEPQVWQVEVNNQFGDQELTVYGPIGLGVPTQKEGHDPPVGLDHFLVYEVIEGPSLEVDVRLNDQFGDEVVTVYEPVAFANPVRKTHDGEVTEIMNPELHWVGYWIEGEYFETEVQVVNQFGEQTLDVYGPVLLGVPSEKISASRIEPLAVAAVLGDYDSQLRDLLLANNISAEERDWDVIYDMGDYDVVVVNEPYDPGSTWFQALLDTTSDNGVGVVFTSSYPIDSSWGISLLEWYSGDPAGQSTGYGLGDVYYKVTQEHPIFDGWEVGDEITIITGGDRDHAWFWDYSGDAIGEVGAAYVGIQGDAVAVGTYGGSTHVLLASLGPQGYTYVMHWTNDAKTIFVNAVCYAAGI